MKRIACTTLLVATFAVAACSRTPDGDVVIERPGDVDITSTTDTLRLPNVPDVDVNMKRDTVIVDRPSITVKRDSGVKKDSIR
jgi:hypothetical protein